MGNRWLTAVLCVRAELRVGMYRVTAILSAVRGYPPQTRCVFRVHSKSRTARDTKCVERRPGAPCVLPLPLSHPSEDLPRSTARVEIDWAGGRVDESTNGLMNECDPPQAREAASLDSVLVMQVRWCSPQVICLRDHASAVKAAVGQLLEDEEVETRYRGHPGMRR